MGDGNNGNWSEYERYVMGELHRLAEVNERIDTRLAALSSELADIRARSTVWGLIGGLLPAMGMVLMYLMMVKH